MRQEEHHLLREMLRKFREFLVFVGLLDSSKPHKHHTGEAAKSLKVSVK